MAKVYVVFGGYGYDGYAKPDSIWTTKEAARARTQNTHGYDSVDILEYEMDAVADPVEERVM